MSTISEAPNEFLADRVLYRVVCDGPYGFSIGRGAWTFKTGEWTNVRQDVVLNTPGVGDGSFQVFINGGASGSAHFAPSILTIFKIPELKLKADAVVFRKAPDAPAPSTADAPTPVASPAAPALASASAGIQGGLLGGLLGNAGVSGGLGSGLGGGLAGGLGGLRRRQLPVGTGVAAPPKAPAPAPSTNSSSSAHIFRTVGQTTVTVTHTPTSTRAVTSTSTVAAPGPSAPALLTGAKGIVGSLLNNAKTNDDVSFIGVAFDCFFGGNSKSYGESFRPAPTLRTRF